VASQEEIKNAIDRATKTLTAKPEAGRVTKTATVEWLNGLRCVASEGGFSVTCDMPAAMGGDGGEPGPGHLSRSALGVCQTISLAIAFARHSVAFSGLRVRVEVDMDAGGGLGIEGAAKGYAATRCIVELESDADPKLIDKAMGDAWSNSQIGNVFSQPVPLSCELHLNSGRAAAELRRG